jgi:outer membrane lipoprotein carrier protein
MSAWFPAAKGLAAGVLSLLLAWSPDVRADAVDTLRSFVRDVQSGQAAFTQTVTAPDGVKKKTSSGAFEFARPNRFRFDYLKPYPQLILGDGAKVWLHDPDLQQVTVRAMDRALGSSPAALLTGQGLDKDFFLKAEASAGGVDWVLAVPRVTDGAAFQSMRVGFKGKSLSAVDILDSFGQRTVMQFEAMAVNPSLGAERFVFKVPPGVDVLQP